MYTYNELYDMGGMLGTTKNDRDGALHKIGRVYTIWGTTRNVGICQLKTSTKVYGTLQDWGWGMMVTS